jgi:hypothetical protein
MRFNYLPAVILLVTFSTVLACADDAPKHDAQQLGKAYKAFVETLDYKRIARDYAKAVQKLDSDDPNTVMAGLRTLATTEEPAVIPWIVPLLDANDLEVRVWAGSSLQKVVSAHELKRRDFAQSSKIVIKPRRPDDLDLRPLASVIHRMLQKPDDGSTHSYAATMIGYLNLREFEPELRTLLKSRHPAVTNATKFALEMIGTKVAFSDQELASARSVGESFGELFRKSDEDNLGLLLLPKDAISKVLNANVLEEKDADALYTKMVAANTQRFREFRSMFTDLSKTNTVTFQPGHMAKSEFYADDARMMKNSFVTLAYSNRVEVKIKIEEMVVLDGTFFIVEID